VETPDTAKEFPTGQSRQRSTLPMDNMNQLTIIGFTGQDADFHYPRMARL